MKEIWVCDECGKMYDDEFEVCEGCGIQGTLIREEVEDEEECWIE